MRKTRRNRNTSQFTQIFNTVNASNREYRSTLNEQRPLLNLPIEITCLIFRYALGRRAVEEDGDADTLTEVVLSHVCRRWRSIALGCQQLWRRFWYNGAKSRHSHVDRFDTYMERSQDQPLHLWFEFRGECAESRHIPLVQRALAYVDRWERFALFSGPYPGLLWEFRVLKDAAAPLLEYFVLYLDEIWEGGVDGELMESLETNLFRGGAPRLKFTLLDSSLATSMPLMDNITFLRLEISGTILLRWLQCEILIELLSLPTLIDVSVVGDLLDELPENPLPLFEMPQLKRLRIGGADGFWPILQHLRAPQLHTLIIYECSIFGPIVTEDDIQSSSAYSFPSLRKLWLLETYSDAVAAQHFIEMTSAATEVFISHVTFTSSFLGIVITFLDLAGVWPQLRTLTCNIEGLTGIINYLDFARLRSVSLMLHKKLISSWKFTFPETLEELKSLVKIVEFDEDFSSGSESFWPQDMDFPRFYLPEKEDYCFIKSYY